MAYEFELKKISEPPQPGFSRRDLLKRLGVMVGMAAFPPVLLQTRTRAQTAAGEPFVSLTAPEAETLRAIVARLIPADENDPGASEARAARYTGRAVPVALKSQSPASTVALAA